MGLNKSLGQPDFSEFHCIFIFADLTGDVTIPIQML